MNYIDYLKKSVHKNGDRTVIADTTLDLNATTGEFEKIKQIILSSELPRKLQLDLCVVAEEIFVNICQYAFPDKSEENKVTFTFEHFDRIVMRFEDGGIQYDPRESVTDADDYDIDEQIGGLGKLIAFTVADEVTYEYKDNKNTLIMTKYFKED